MADHTDLRGARILLVDDMPANLDLLYALLEPEGYKLSMAPNGEVALRIATETEAVPDLILLDVMMPGMDGFEVCRRLKDDERTQAIPVVFVTADGMTESVVTGFEAGGVDYISKPIRNEEVLMRVRTHLRIRHLTRELDGRNCELVDKNRQLEEEIALRKLLKGQVSEMAERQARECGLEALIGRSAAMQGVLEEIVRLQGEDGGALITGEPGTGKELVARAIHFGGKRAGSPFVVVNCAEFPTDVVESLESRTRALSLLCGHVTGAFQGADSDQEGYLQLADGGTLFLDEVARVPSQLQMVLTRALGGEEVRHLGEQSGRALNVRLLAGSTRNASELAAGGIRQELRECLSAGSVRTPPLRERWEDIPMLAQHFAHEVMDRMGRKAPEVSAEVLSRLQDHPFPGNVRELKNAIERALIESGGRAVGPEHLHLGSGSRATVADGMENRVIALCAP